MAGWAAAIGIPALLVVAALTARVSLVSTAVLFALALVATALSAHRWPRATLLGASLAVLADPRVVPILLDDAVSLGPIGFSEPLLAATAAVIAIDAYRHRRLRRALRDPVLALTALFVALAVVSAVLNLVPPVVAILGIVMTVDAIAIYFVARMLPAERHAPIAIGGVVAAAVAVAAFGIAQVVLDPNLLGFVSFEGRFGEGGRITSFIGNPNMVAAVIGIALPFPLYASSHLERASHRWMARAVLFILVLALLLTFSRGGWLAVGLATVVGCLIIDWRSLVPLVVCIALAWGVATVMPRGLAVTTDPNAPPPPPPPDIIDSTASRIGNLGDEGDLRMRFIRDGLPIVGDHLLLGVGPGRYGGAVATIIESPVYEAYDTELFGFRTVHNFWLHLLGESGVLGTAAFLALLIGLIVRFARGARATTGTTFILLGGAATTVLVVSVNSLTEMVLEGNMPVILAWLVIGVASVLVPVSGLREPVAVDESAVATDLG